MSQTVDDEHRQRALAANLRHLERKLTPAQLAEIRTPAPVADGATVPAVPPAQHAADPVGLVEIAKRLGLYERTPRTWWNRRVTTGMPEPDYESINGMRAWEWATILRWCGATGRLEEGTAMYDEFVERFGVKPLERRVGGSMTQEQAARSEKLLNPRKKKST